MPEHLHPGVYVEETSSRAKSIEGVSTSTAGFVGQCAYGPIQGLPRPVTSFVEFERTFGGTRDLALGAATTGYLAHAVRAFFDNGGRRLYVARVFRPAPGRTVATSTASASLTFPSGATFRARYPGLDGELALTISKAVGENALVGTGVSAQLTGLRAGDLVAIDPATDAPAAWVVREDDGRLWLTADGASEVTLGALAYAARVSLKLTVAGGGREDVHDDLSTHPSSARFIGRVLREVDPSDRAPRVWLDHGAIVDDAAASNAIALADALLPAGSRELSLAGGSDGEEMTSTEVIGGGSGDAATGLAALAAVDDVAIVAAPGAAALADHGERRAVRDALISHCETLRYRFAILSVEGNAGVADARAARALHDSSYAALYYPWVLVQDPNGEPGDLLRLPPDGFVAGIYARTDTERGVHKAPANALVRGALGFATTVNAATHGVLNPEGINCLRFFAGRGNRVWGARTISSDPEWKYINVRRLFIYLQHSIDRGTRWVVFEPNSEALWSRVRATIEAFLTDLWRSGALMGAVSKEAFFVRCDRSTMTQDDIDSGRLVCLVGVAPIKPAEFVVVRIVQRTAAGAIP